jgi:hemolysin III
LVVGIERAIAESVPSPSLAATRWSTLAHTRFLTLQVAVAACAMLTDRELQTAATCRVNPKSLFALTSKSLGMSSVPELTPDGWPPQFPWNYDRSELVADALVHAIGVGLGLLGGVVLVVHAVHTTHGSITAAVSIYAVGLIAMLGISAAYNVYPVCRTKWLLRRLDHSAIYVLIAATYTPFLAATELTRASAGLLVAVWLVAIGGVLLKLLLPGRLDRLSVALYLLLGWAGAAAYPVMATLPSSTLLLIAAGGVLYSAGVAFHLWESLRFQNATWHALVLVAAGCHYTAVLDCLP